jgi:nitrile hydratase subunit beta
MNGIHDMGGMHGMGPIVYEKDEPVFHEAWERRVWGLQRVLGPWGRGRRWGSFRYDLERIPPAEYLRMSYYERWFTVAVSRLMRSDLITAAELETGKANPSRPKPALLPAPAAVPAVAASSAVVKPRFKPGQNVRSRNLHPQGHTRQPRYTRGKRGTIIRDNGVFALQDTDLNGQSLGGRLQHVYTVRFTARELWGEAAALSDSVYVDLWEDYLERA